jgi:hypothetical protein
MVLHGTDADMTEEVWWESTDRMGLPLLKSTHEIGNPRLPTPDGLMAKHGHSSAWHPSVKWTPVPGKMN